MSGSEDEHIRRMRSVLKQARTENARMVAAAVGGHLAGLSKTSHANVAVDEATEAVRDASFDLLRSLSRRTDVSAERHRALVSVDRLKDSLASASPAVPPEPLTSGRTPLEKARTMLRGLGRR